MPVWLRELFGVEKPVIAMAHILALPGTPRYDSEKGIDHLVAWVQADVGHLIQAGVYTA